MEHSRWPRMRWRRTSPRDGVTTWSSVTIPRCPVNGNVVDAQLALGANHRIYAGYMDGNAQYRPIMVSYSESRMSVPTPYHDYQAVTGFDHPYGDYTETVTDGSGNFFSIWAEGESKLGSGHVYYAKY